MVHVVRKSDVDEFDVDICQAYQEFRVACDGNYYLLLNLTKVISVAAVGECNDLLVGISNDGTNLVDVEPLCFEKHHEYTVHPFELGTTTRF